MSGFAVQGLSADAFAVIGGWRSLPEDALSFAAGPEDEETLLWRADLPANELAARELLARQEAELAASEELVVEAGTRLLQLQPGMVAEAAASFSTVAEMEPEEELLMTLGALRAEVTGDVSFALGLPGLPADWRETVADYLAFTRQMLRLLQPSLQIETRVGETLIAVSRFQLGGDADHSWPVAFPAEQAWQHGRTVRLTLQTRRALLGLMTEVTSGAIVLAPRFLGGGASAILALPATYKFIKSSVAKLRQLRTLEGQLRAVS